jgi:hypothetical protein
LDELHWILEALRNARKKGWRKIDSFYAHSDDIASDTTTSATHPVAPTAYVPS